MGVQTRRGGERPGSWSQSAATKRARFRRGHAPCRRRPHARPTCPRSSFQWIAATAVAAVQLPPAPAKMGARNGVVTRWPWRPGVETETQTATAAAWPTAVPLWTGTGGRNSFSASAREQPVRIASPATRRGGCFVSTAATVVGPFALLTRGGGAPGGAPFPSHPWWGPLPFSPLPPYVRRTFT